MVKQFKKLFISLLSISAISTAIYSKSTIVLNDNEKEFLRQHPVITVHNEINYPPYNFNENGQPKGLSIEYMNLLASKLGLKIKYISGYEWNEFIKLIKSNKLDVMLNIMRTAPREKFLNFTEPYAATYKAVFSNSPMLKSLKDLNGKLVCVPKNFYIEHFLEAYHPEIILKREESVLGCIRSVDNATSEATVGSLSTIHYLMNENKIDIANSNIVLDKRLTIGLSIATASNQKTLRDILQKAMYSVSEDELIALASKWIGIEANKRLIAVKKSNVKPYTKKRVIRMCNNPNWAPIEFAKDNNMNEMSGIAIDTLKILEKSLNVEFKNISTSSWSESQKFLRDGKCEVLSAAAPTDDRRKYANFTTPYLVYKLAIITKNDKPFIGGLDDVSDKSIARKKGSALISKLKTLYPHIDIIETKEYIDSLKKVASGEAYCTIATLPVASYLINKFSLKNLHIAGYTDMKYRLSIAVKKDDRELLSKLDTALSEITQKQHNRIYNKWIDGKIVESFDYRYILYPLGMILGIMLLVIYRQNILRGANRNLQKEIKEKVNENLIQHQFIQEQAKMAAMGEMIGVIAHQWRQPLNALGLSIQNLAYSHEDNEIDDRFVDDFIDKNVKTIKFMSQTIDDFRDFFKIDKIKENFSVKGAIESTFYMQEIDLVKHNISFQIIGDNFYTYGLKSEFQQVILNLISNSKDAILLNRDNDRKIDIYLEDRVVVFMDNGGGISEEIIGNIFESYFTTKKQNLGMGIGLYMSRMIIEDHMGGAISAYSKGDGTVILLDFAKVTNVK